MPTVPAVQVVKRGESEAQDHSLFSIELEASLRHGSLSKKNKKINNNKKPKSLIINFKIWDLENIHWMLARNFCVLNDSKSIHSFIFIVSYSFSFLFFLSPSCSISSPLLPLFLSVIRLYFLHASPSQPKNRMLWYLTSLSKLLLLTYNVVLNKY